MSVVGEGKMALTGKRIRLCMLLAAIGLSIKYIFVDFGIDAEFQISMAYRLATGDAMFKEMWEAYQMSAFLCAFFIKIYLAIFKTTTGIVLYLQIIGALIDWGVAYLLYRTVSKYLNSKNVGFAMAWLLVVVSPKDVPLPEYANMQIWFSLILCITIFLYYKTKSKILLVISALSLCAAVLSYPSCLLLVPGVAFLFLYKGEKKELFWFLAVCAATGVLYLCVTMRNITLEEFGIFFENMLAMETSHAIGVGEKFLAYLIDAGKIALLLAIAYLIAYGIAKVMGMKKKNIGDKQAYTMLADIMFCLLVMLISLYMIPNWRVYNRYSYTVLFLAVIVIGMRYARKLSGDKLYFYYCGTIISVLNFLATLILTDLELLGSVPYLLIAVAFAFLPISEAWKDADEKVLSNAMKRLVLICGVFLLAFRNVYIIRPMYLQANTIFDIRGIVKEGPAIGIISEYMGPYMQNASVEEWEQYVPDGSNIWLIGDPLDTLGYLYADTNIAAPSTVCTPGYNESVLEYWKMNPDKYPDVVIASCWYGTLNSELVNNEWIMNWLEEEFQPSHYVDGKYWRYYYK